MSTKVASRKKPELTTEEKAALRRSTRTTHRAVLVSDVIKDMVSVRVVGPKGPLTLTPVRLHGGNVRVIVKIKGEVVVDEAGNRQLFTISNRIIESGKDLFLTGAADKKIAVKNVWRCRRPKSCEHTRRCSCT